jgi:hypothetical protein
MFPDNDEVRPLEAAFGNDVVAAIDPNADDAVSTDELIEQDANQTPASIESEEALIDEIIRESNESTDSLGINDELEEGDGVEAD